jgi:ribosomal protein L37AE/L43A
MIVCYFVQIIIPRPTRGLHIARRTLKLKARIQHLKVSKNLTEICWKCLRVTVRYFVQIIWKIDVM